ncbi:MAG: AIM24 family protein [Candidatus Methanospirare jalkutatii]|nr:AIM24 family protein [Candidatus Methanospirare jalkutatii]
MSLPVGSLSRKLAGETFFLTEFTPRSGEGFVAFAGNAPGRIKAIELKGEEFIAQKDAFLCAQEGVASILLSRRSCVLASSAEKDSFLSD